MACAADTDAERLGAVSSAQMFEQAVRRDPTELERSRVARIGYASCTGFFLENTSGTTFVASALHCFYWDAENWCATNGWLRVGDGFTDGASDEDGDGRDDAYGYGEDDPNDGWCSRIIAAEPTLDIVVFEADLPHPAEGDSTFRLAAYEPKVQTRAVLTGFPSDDDRDSKITTSENCWLLSGVNRYPLQYGAPGSHIIDANIKHNCSAFPGNSGGPFSIEGTRDAIGVVVAAASEPKVSASNDLMYAATSSPTSAFVALHRAALEEAGIVLSASQDPVTLPAPAARAPVPAPPSAPPTAPSPRPTPAEPSAAPTVEASAGCSAVGGRDVTNGEAAMALLALVAFLRRRVTRASR